MGVALAILPLAMLIGLGYGLAKSGIVPRGQWGQIETLSFRVLIPAVLVLAIMEAELSFVRFAPFVAALLLSLSIIGVTVLVARLIAPDRLKNPQLTSVFQLGIRWNAFVALAAAEQFIGPEGLAIIAIGIAILIPVINVVCILVLATFGPEVVRPVKILKTILKNPLVQACAVGLALNLTGAVLPAAVAQTVDMVGRGALGIGLLAIGAGISLRRLARISGPVVLAVFLRPILAPMVFFAIATALGLPPLQVIAGVLILGSPAASNGYIVAKQMGGDANLYADALTWQIVICVLALPVWALFLTG